MALCNLFLDVRDRFSWVQVLGARLRAVHDSVATVKLKGIVQIFQSLLRKLVPAIVDPSKGLHKDRRT